MSTISHEKSLDKSKDSKLIYLGSLICQKITELEILIDKGIELREEGGYHPTVDFLFSLRDKWVMLLKCDS